MEAERTRSRQLCKEKSGAASFKWRGEQALMPWGKKEFALRNKKVTVLPGRGVVEPVNMVTCHSCGSVALHSKRNLFIDFESF